MCPLHIFCHRAARCNSPRSALHRSSQRAAPPFAARCVFPLLLILPFAKRNRLTVTAPATLPGKHHLITSRADWEQDHETPLCPGRQKATITRAMGGACSPSGLTSGTHAKITQKTHRNHSGNTLKSLWKHAESTLETRRKHPENTQKSPRKHAEITRGRSGASHRRRFVRPGVPAAYSPYTAPHAGSTADNRHTDS